MEMELKSLYAQMNPHFIFNCLNSIQRFVMENDKLNANKYLADFAQLMRQTLDNSKDGIITLTNEVEYLENYISFEHMRFKDKFSYAIEVDPGIQRDRIELPSMIIQPFVENAIRHGLNNLEKRPGLLRIRFYRRKNFLYCMVDDNGIGMDEAQKLKERAFIKYQSHGMDLTRKRLALVSKMQRDDYKIFVTSKRGSDKNPEGTTVIIKFPLQS
jgi:sensor histidine kinase YesM